MENPICPNCEKCHLLLSHRIVQGRSVIMEKCLGCNYETWVKSFIIKYK